MAARKPTAPGLTGDPPAFRALNEIGIISQLATTTFERAVPEGMTIAQFSVLNHFVRLGGTRTPSALARAFQVSKGTMTSTLGRLVEKGLIEIVPDEIDARAKQVAITAAGRRMREACVAALAPALAELTRRVSPDTLAALLPLLAELRTTLDAMREE
ncbi:MAG: MarR family transcriptional regulator [Alphaproteobacteria bacterium]|nr:MarR family transcriptional regulator [Alphaproteobacteria bacterium]